MELNIDRACISLGCICAKCSYFGGICCALKIHEGVKCPDDPGYSQDYQCPDFMPKEEPDNAT